MTNYNPLAALIAEKANDARDVFDGTCDTAKQAVDYFEQLILAALIAGVKVKPLEWELRANKEGVVYCAYDPLYGREVEAPNERTCDAIDQDRTARILAALSAAHHVNETPKSEHAAGNVLTVPDLVEAGLTKERDELRDMLERAQHVVPDLYTEWHEKAASLLKGSYHD